ncbi:MAG: response regulator [Ardenticatenaceae bacterium]|nr:response regulator [Ardenticatenaceae bacterium]
MRILYVEDNVDDADLTIRAIKKQAPTFDVDTVPSLEEARQVLFGQANYDVLLADLRLPDGNGLELLIEVRQKGLPLAVVILTGSGDEDTAVAALKAGADDYLPKQSGYRKQLPATLEAALSRFKTEAALKTGLLRVLYVEHHDADADLMQRHLDRYAPHIHLDIFHTAEEALARLEQTEDAVPQYDVLLLDYRLPGTNGLELIKKLRDEYKVAMPIIVITGQGNEEIATQALRLGAADYLVKYQGYLHKLPIMIENVYHRARLAQERIALNESEARFRRLAENAQDIIFRIRLWPERQYEYVSPAATQITGYTPEEFYADPNLGFEMIHPEDFSRLEMSNRADFPFEHLFALRWIHKDGTEYWTEQRNVPIYDEDGRLIAIEGISRDITKRIKFEEEVRLQSAALNSAANAIVITDPAGAVIWANPAFSSLTGYSIDESIGKTPGQLINSGVQNVSFYSKLWTTILSGKVWHGELINRRKDGTLYSEEMTITPLKDKAGKISHFIAIKQDISERKKTEEDRVRLLNQIREQANRIQRIMDTVPEGVLLISNDGIILSANPTAQTDLVALAGDPVPEFVTHLGDKALADILSIEHSHEWQTITTKDRQYTLIARPMEDAAEQGYWVLVLNDVTEERERQRYQQAQERLATVGQLAAGIAHDFNNVMGVIMLYAKMLQRNPTLQKKERGHLDLISDRAQHAANLISQILDFSRRSIMDLVPLNLRPLLKQMIKLLEQTLPENITLHLKYSENNCIIEGDPTRLQQVIMNLALNARDAMPTGGRLDFELSCLSITNEHEAPLPDLWVGDWVKLAVKDTGTGIPPEVLPHLFEPFFSTKPPGKGTGLGLAQVYGIVKQHKGSIDVVSKPGGGTSFFLYLPLLQMPLINLEPEEEDELLPGGDENILLVEDNLAMQQSVRETLEGLGYTIFSAVNGVAALDILAKEDVNIDLILSDLIMPGMGGVALYHHLQKEYPSIKMLIMTGYAGDAATVETLKRENMPYLQKPFLLSDLAQNIRNILE